MRNTILIVLSVFVFFSCATNTKKGAEWLDIANSYLDNGEYADAIKAYNKSIKYDKSNFTAYYYRGIAYYLTENYDLAIDDFTYLIDEVPDNPFAYISRGDSYGAKGLYHKTFADYLKGLDNDYDPSSFRVDKSNKADMWLCGVIYKEILINDALNRSEYVTKYVDMLTIICNNFDISIEYIETFYHNNLPEIVSSCVDEVSFSNDEKNAEIKEIITAYLINPSKETYDNLESLYKTCLNDPNGWTILFTVTQLDTYATRSLGWLLMGQNN